MSTRKLKNLPLKTLRKFLIDVGCNKKSTKGGHEKWIGKNFKRPIILQSHISPVPIRIIKQILIHLDMTKDEFLDVLDGKINLTKSKYDGKRITLRGNLNHDIILDKIKKDNAIICDVLNENTDYVIAGTGLNHETYNSIKKYNITKLKPRVYLSKS